MATDEERSIPMISVPRNLVYGFLWFAAGDIVDDVRDWTGQHWLSWIVLPMLLAGSAYLSSHLLDWAPGACRCDESTED